LSPQSRAGGIVLADDSRVRSPAGRTELKQILETARVIVVLLSDELLRSPLMSKLKLPGLLDAADDQGAAVRWILVSHCLYETTPFGGMNPLNDARRPLDSLNAGWRDAVLGGIARQVHALFDAGATDPAGAPLFPPGENTPAEPAPEAATGTPPPAKGGAAAGTTIPEAHVSRLEEVIDYRKRGLLIFENLARQLRWFSLGLLAMALVASAIRVSVPLLLLIAGAALFVASIGFVLQRRIASIGESLITAQYVRSGLIDESLPSRQRAALMQKADVLLGQKL
jgi:hypothetical protein